MGKPTGFLQYDRKVDKTYESKERIKNCKEFHIMISEEERKQQAARCMDCGIPFCHTGITLNAMASGCPLNNLIPEWNDLIYKGLWKEALERLLKTNDFPEFTSRVCPAPCEGACTEGLNDLPVTIKENEYAIISKAFNEGWIVPQIPSVRTGKKVAVVGSGPAGLACALRLNRYGHWVTVFEREDRIGGLLMYGIPNMKLDKKIVQRRVELMKQEGIRFVTNTEVGLDYPAQKLIDDFDAAVLCTGATKPRDIQIQGRKLNGIYFAVDFLKQNTKRLLNNADESRYISAKDKDVIVIGGGDTGTDCAATAIRHGCKSVTQLEIMPKPPIDRAKDNPWPQFPRIFKIDYGQEEANIIFGKDPREYYMMTTKFVGDNKSNVTNVHAVKVKWEKDKDGRFVPRPIDDSERVYSAQLVLIAVGFLGPEDILFDSLKIERNERSNVKTKLGSFMTNIKGIFTAGDMHTGQSLVVKAINEGKCVAEQCNKYLTNIKK